MAYESADSPIDTSNDREELIKLAGDTYTGELEQIRDNLDADDQSGSTLGTMVENQLKLTEAETRYAVKSGIPTKATKVVKAAADDVKRAAG